MPSSITKEALIKLYADVLDGDLNDVLKTIDGWLAEYERIEKAWKNFTKHDRELKDLIEGLRDA